jgi:hypothetical protein
MDNLILTISGNTQEKDNILKNIKMIDNLKNDNYRYFVYTNYDFEDGYKKLDFTYFNECFYNIRNVIKSFDWLLLLDGDDNFTGNKINIIDNILKNTDKSYIHNYAYYDNIKYDYNGINNNNSCITVKANKINFDLFLHTKSLSDYLLWLPFYDNEILELKEKLTYIHNKEMNYREYHNYMFNRYKLRLMDLSLLIKELENEPATNQHSKFMLNRLKKEYAKYSYILNENKKYLPDLFTLLNHKKGADYFISREYILRYGNGN